MLAAGCDIPRAAATSAPERPFTSRSTSAARWRGGMASSASRMASRSAKRQDGSLPAGSMSASSPSSESVARTGDARPRRWLRARLVATRKSQATGCS